MRVVTAVVIWALVVEVLIGLAFLAGYCWIGGYQMGLLIAGATLLVMALPWVGELAARYDSADGSMRATVGWWGRVAITQKPESLLEVRVCGIPWRKKLGAKKSDDGASPPAPLRSGEGRPAKATADDTSPDSPTRARPRVRMQVTHENVDDVTRAVTAALAAGNDLLWDATEVYFRIDAPAEHAAYDDVIARIVAHRGVGPVDVKVTRGEGKRRIRGRYRIGLFRAAAIAMCMAAQGRVWSLNRSLRKPVAEDDEDTAGEGARRTTADDEQLVRDMVADMKEGDDDGV
jgi:hypothetical protein